MGICALCYIYIGCVGVMVFQRSMLNWRRWVGSICNGYMCLWYIYVMYVVYWFSRDLCLIGGGGGVNLQWVYVHCTIPAKFGVMVSKTSMLN